MSETDTRPEAAPETARREPAVRWSPRRRRPDLVVLVAAVLFTVTVSVVRAFTTPLLATADETAHLDYALQLWHGALPVFEDGVRLVQPWGPVPPVQWVAQHPPLFYALLAPLVGTLADSGHLYTAVLAGRAANALLAGATVLAVWWAARQIFRRDRAIAAVAAVVTSMTGMLVLVAGSIYNDLLTVVFAALAVGMSARFVREGVTPVSAVVAVLVCTGGLASRASFVVFLAAVLGGVLVARRRSRLRRDVLARVATAVAAIAVPLAAVGWFYARNLALTGSVTGGHPEWAAANLGRNTHTVVEVVQAPTFWTGLFSLYRYDVDRSVPWPWAALLGPLAVALVGALVLVVRRRLRPSRPDLLVALMLLAVTGLTIGMQLAFVAGGGAPNTRYSLPLLAVLAPLMAWGLTRGGRAGVVLVVAWTAGVFVACLSALDLVTPVGPQVVLDVARVLFAVSVLAGVVFLAAVAVLLTRGPRWSPDDLSAPDSHGQRGRRRRGAPAPSP
ncbi:glycosyltransferase family 39 protein [Frigoribacterium sp. PhB116]|uniref:glycosyltransferase family 39 protein n=1 Tax=Frigoribacterium sp. PhB116 TaxID=2485174 RepID=UPI00105C501A|nr:glycosyltransferase family 39 protein [Frigoribacterium sp. PhB116]TDT66075.1 hypothetical protein EDF20_0879 [Frigoribacterium sp. PhB116]